MPYYNNNREVLGTLMWAKKLFTPRPSDFLQASYLYQQEDKSSQVSPQVPMGKKSSLSTTLRSTCRMRSNINSPRCTASNISKEMFNRTTKLSHLRLFKQPQGIRYYNLVTRSARVSPTRRSDNLIPNELTYFFTINERGEDIKQTYQQRFILFRKSIQRKNKNRKIDVFIEELDSYFYKTYAQYLRSSLNGIIKMAKYIIKCLSTGDSLSISLVKDCLNPLPKIVFELAQELYLFKYKRFCLPHHVKIQKNIYFYSRSLNMLHLTLVCCADLGRLYCDNFEFDKASYSYTKAIKLSVYLGNKLKEEQYMDRLGMCQYYKGDSIGALYYHNKLGKLSTYDVNTIKELYSNEEELELLLAERMKRMRMKESYDTPIIWKPEFIFDTNYEVVKSGYQNATVFKAEIKNMIKMYPLRQKMPIIKGAMAKVYKIGSKKYYGRNYKIPRACHYHNENNYSSQEVLQSHRSQNRSNRNCYAVQVDRDVNTMQYLLAFFLYTQSLQDLEEEESLDY